MEKENDSGNCQSEQLQNKDAVLRLPDGHLIVPEKLIPRTFNYYTSEGVFVTKKRLTDEGTLKFYNMWREKTGIKYPAWEEYVASKQVISSLEKRISELNSEVNSARNNLSEYQALGSHEEISKIISKCSELAPMIESVRFKKLNLLKPEPEAPREQKTGVSLKKPSLDKEGIEMAEQEQPLDSKAEVKAEAPAPQSPLEGVPVAGGTGALTPEVSGAQAVAPVAQQKAPAIPPAEKSLDEKVLDAMAERGVKLPSYTTVVKFEERVYAASPESEKPTELQKGTYDHFVATNAIRYATKTKAQVPAEAPAQEAAPATAPEAPKAKVSKKLEKLLKEAPAAAPAEKGKGFVLTGYKSGYATGKLNGEEIKYKAGIGGILYNSEQEMIFAEDVGGLKIYEQMRKEYQAQSEKARYKSFGGQGPI